MNISKVTGKNNKHKVFLYTLSWCGFCKSTKQYLSDNSVEYEYVDVDLCKKEDKKKIHEIIQSKGGRLSYPTIIVDESIVITGFREDKLKVVLEI